MKSILIILLSFILLLSLSSARNIFPYGPVGQMGEINAEEREWMIPSMAKRVPSAGDMMVRFG
ncbi:hypothetical protein PRIPAC_91724 [Pristionchus pacificus]|uniref:Uncharacterized protein n=1 Tax=Pristionchus pacificus TaxID=54126 RepID=A0A454XN26_PRIPA|nr:hypothetical protein PRIPAC_91724 [Pristionchus pacificus]|eukprot:PDM70129.1 hypothetical protein PRIPAC_45076 [Pristionchus pacificus]